MTVSDTSGKGITDVIFDFDGVIINSAEIRRAGFRHIFQDEPPSLVQDLIRYHDRTGGVSRYEKIRYYFREIKGIQVEEDRVAELAGEFRDLMLQELGHMELLIPETVEFIRRHSDLCRLYLVSGSDQAELRTLCKRLGLWGYFDEILGSPTPKPENLASLIERRGIRPSNAVYIGDSLEDLKAATQVGLPFFGYNNPELRYSGDHYIESFDDPLPL